MSEIVLTVEGVDPRELYGENNSKLNLLREAYPEVNITSRGNQLKISGKKKYTQNAKDKFEMMVRILREKDELPVETIENLLKNQNVFVARKQNGNTPVIVYGRNGKAVKAKTQNQIAMVELSEKNDILFAIGPAGTGKTYTAVALAVRALKNRMVKKIILTRPAVEAGESLGFLPGDLKEKIDPYLRPLYDALEDMIESEKLDYFMSNRTIEVAPLAYMRGRTLDNAYIILDEAQNATVTQIKMFLTRLGPSAKCIITGDLSQVDLPRNTASGLRKAVHILGDLKGIGKIFLSAEDVVRHRLVKDIILAFGKEAEREREAYHGKLPGRSSVVPSSSEEE